MQRTLYALACVLLVAAPAFAQNPCTTPPDNAIIPGTNIHRAWAELPQQADTLPDGTPVVTGYQYGAWIAGQDVNTATPAQGPTSIPKSAWVPVAGFANCYELSGGFPGLIPTQQRMVASLRAAASAGAPQPFSAWSAPSNSFSLASVRVTPAAPGQTRVRP